MAEAPIAQKFADELNELLEKFKDSGLSNAEAIGVLSIYHFNLMSQVREDARRE